VGPGSEERSLPEKAGDWERRKLVRLKELCASALLEMRPDLYFGVHNPRKKEGSGKG